MAKMITDILNCPIVEIKGQKNRAISTLAFDSRKCEQDSMFFAICGTVSDGHDFIEKAIEKGARIVVCEKLPGKIHDDVTYVVVLDSAYTLGCAASNYFDNPSQSLKLVGVTGTNGKTTIATLLYRLFVSQGYACGLLSTIENLVDNKVVAATHTTPDPIELNALLAKMVEKGCTYAFMEVSSHAIDQKRIAGLKFAGGIFTNLTHDHLDYHKTIAAYRDAKKKFFDDLSADAFALTNIDDKNGNYMLQNTNARKYAYGLKSECDFKGRVVENSFEGLILNINENEIYTQLVGRFNASNLLAIYGAAILLGLSVDEALKGVSALHGAAGRFQIFRSESGIVAIVDYAHTPDALQNVLQTINDIRTHNEKLITVVGAGGNRDTTKRPEMADIAAELSDRVILTSDNPRFEDPEEIIHQMLKGVQPQHFNRVLSITNRKEAIKTAVALAQKDDIILVAGKGHENYQEINGVKHHFDDMEVLSEIFVTNCK